MQSLHWVLIISFILNRLSIFHLKFLVKLLGSLEINFASLYSSFRQEFPLLLMEILDEPVETILKLINKIRMKINDISTDKGELICCES